MNITLCEEVIYKFIDPPQLHFVVVALESWYGERKQTSVGVDNFQNTVVHFLKKTTKVQLDEEVQT